MEEDELEAEDILKYMNTHEEHKEISAKDLSDQTAEDIIQNTFKDDSNSGEVSFRSSHDPH